VLVTLVILRFQLPHQALAVLYGVDRATITRAIHEIRPLLAGPGFTVPGQPGLRLRSLAAPHRHGHRCWRLSGPPRRSATSSTPRHPSQAKTRQPSRSPSTRPAPKQQSSRRICVEHAIAEPKQWRPLQRWIGRRHYDAQAHLAVAGLVSDRTAPR
jgi:hypothetical protein